VQSTDARGKATKDPKVERRPHDSEIDAYGLTHRGKARATNQDHFLICSLHKQMKVHHTSLPQITELPVADRRLAFLAMVADGVGSGRGEDASRHAIETMARYVSYSMHCYYTADPTDEEVFAKALEEAALHAHAEVLSKAGADDAGNMATTLTLFLSTWPRSYILQVGDSRCYLYRDDTLTQISRDQTMAQELMDRGVFTRADAATARWAHVLSSSIGGQHTAPVVTGIDRQWNDVGLLCSDGLTKHVSDEQIKHRLATMTSARQVCEALIEDALEDGGSDNITVLVGRTTRKLD